MLPLCRRHHNVRHQIGPTRFNKRYSVDLLLRNASFEPLGTGERTTAGYRIENAAGKRVARKQSAYGLRLRAAAAPLETIDPGGGSGGVGNTLGPEMEPVLKLVLAEICAAKDPGPL